MGDHPRPNVSRTPIRPSPGARTSETVVWLWKKTTKKAQKVKNQTVKNQKRKINLKMVKINQKMKNQKLQHQQERMANGKNVKSSLVSWEVQLNVLSIPVILLVTMDPIQKVLRRPNVSR